MDVFISYAAPDHAYLEQLSMHLDPLRRRGILRSWSAAEVGAGQDERAEVARRLSSARLILLLVSADYFYSPAAREQMTRALERSRAGLARVIPILVRPCAPHGAEIERLGALPVGGRAVSQWSDRDEAWTNVAVGIQKAIVELGVGETISPMTSPPRSIPHEPPRAEVTEASESPVPFVLIPPRPRVAATRGRSTSRATARRWASSLFALLAAVATSAIVVATWLSATDHHHALPGGVEPRHPRDPAGAVSDAHIVDVDWGPGSAQCATEEPRIILGDCQHTKDLEWLRRELGALRDKRVGCLAGLPASFSLKPGDNERTGVKNYYLNIHGSDGARVANIWIQRGKMKITDLYTRKLVWLAVDRAGKWSAGPDEEHMTRVP